MQTSEANQLRKLWGNAPCDHPHLVKEYNLGSDTGDLVCTQCGRSFYKEPSGEKTKAQRVIKEDE